MLSHFSRVRFCATPQMAAHQAPPSLGFSRQEYWSGLPFTSPGDRPDPGIEPQSPALQADLMIYPPDNWGTPIHLNSIHDHSKPKFLNNRQYFSWGIFASFWTNVLLSRCRGWVMLMYLSGISQGCSWPSYNNQDNPPPTPAKNYVALNTSSAEV